MANYNLQPNTHFMDVPYEIRKEIEIELNKEGKWKRLRSTMAMHGIKSTEIDELTQIKSPAKYLLRKLVTENLTVEVVQVFLTKSKLFDILDKLITNEEVKIINSSQDKSDAVQPGDEHKLSVYVAHCSPYPKFLWYHNNHALEEHRSNELLINNFCPSDVGEYICQVKQTIDGMEKEYWGPRFSLTLGKCKPSIIPEEDLQNIKLNPGEELVLNLGVVAEPQPEYIWYKNGTEVSRGPHHMYKIAKVGKNDEGKYFCKVVNDKGDCDSNEITVEVIPPCIAPDTPVINRKPEVFTPYAFGETVDLSFRVYCRHEVEFSCYINGKSLDDLCKHRSICTSKTSKNYYHMFYLLYEVNKDDCGEDGNGPICINFEACSNGESVSTTVKIEIEDTFRKKQYLAGNKFALLIANEDYSKNNTLFSPVKDMQALAKELTSLDFRCMTCRNVTKLEFLTIVELFCSFIQKGDYVLFYYAGHGYYCKGVDYMIPIHARRISNSDNVPEEGTCVTTREVFNQFQEKKPALIFVINDSCRTEPSVSDDYLKQRVGHKIAEGNRCTIYATSENYSAFESTSSLSSLLVEQLIKYVKEPISVEKLCQKVKSAIYHNGAEDEEHGRQVPIVDSDLVESRSLTDAWTPRKDDDRKVFSEWERISNVRGVKYEKVEVKETPLKVSVQCEQEDKIISNCIDVVINISLDGNHDVQLLHEKQLKVCIILDYVAKEIEKEVTGNEVIRFPVPDLQGLDEDIMLNLDFTSKEEIVASCKFNLGRPSLCDIGNLLSNNLNKLI